MTMPLSEHWAPYTPDQHVPWDLRRVVHLHRRAGFAATWAEIQRDLNDGPVASIDRLLTGKAVAAPADFAVTADVLADAAVAAVDTTRLRAAWFYRMLFGPDPLGEKLTLLWHDHFATANTKVKNTALMRRQNDTLRQHARARFGELLDASLREPALLLYLDAPANRPGHPNENLGRELMELFTLGVGHYSEADVKEAARALTGWTVEEDEFVEAAARHDAGEKTILGRTGKWAGADLLMLLRQHPATADRIAAKLCRQFFGENALPLDAVSALAAGLREHELDIGWAVAVILKSQRFFGEANLRTRVLSPVEFVAGAARALELLDPPPSTLALADWTGRMGQDLFDPPNVGGWPSGRAWIHPRGMITRANYATALMAGPDVGRPRPYDPAILPKKHGFGADRAAVLTFHYRVLFGTDPSDDLRKRIGRADERKMIAVLLSSPEGQLG
jgi:uncharacterized protein (DUF1800 family)